jgi:hypothetical protein
MYNISYLRIVRSMLHQSVCAKSPRAPSIPELVTGGAVGRCAVCDTERVRGAEIDLMLAEYIEPHHAAIRAAPESLHAEIVCSSFPWICLRKIQGKGLLWFSTTTRRPAILTADSQSKLYSASIKSRAAPNSDLTYKRSWEFLNKILI